MLKTNLSVLMAERGMKIADLHEKTNISKTTLMALAENSGKGVQFDTVDKLCVFFGITPKEFFVYSPYIFSYELLEDEDYTLKTLGVTIKNKYYIKTFYLTFYLRSGDSYDFPLSDDSYDLWLSVDLEQTDSYSDEEFFSIIKDLPVTFETDFINNVMKFAKEELNNKLKDGLEVSVMANNGRINKIINKNEKILFDMFTYNSLQDNKNNFRKMEDIIL
ncbi:helix-turn-helix domain-containing protein [Macrococcus animalis]|uniref:helix-turn-helix domain-containing protein n=1 Tax=Macrococcus animalis TaxID=3395467 RepID=UPI0039BE9C76